MENCTLCGDKYLTEVSPAGDRRSYFFCNNCYLIFAHPSLHPELGQEKSRYLEHNNDESDQGYIEFLKKLVIPAMTYISKDMEGLDYGCGPVPALSNLLAEESGIFCDNYDPLFNFKLSRHRYDFIFASECFEHFHFPANDLAFLDQLLVSGGYLFVMSERWKNFERFENWYYKRDFTHISFFHFNTFRYISETMNYNIEYADDHRIVILKKE